MPHLLLTQLLVRAFRMLPAAPPPVLPVMAAAAAHTAGHAAHAATYAAKAVALASTPDEVQINTAGERSWQYEHVFHVI